MDGDAGQATGITVARAARRWGWASLSQFNLAYLRRFGKLAGRAASRYLPLPESGSAALRPRFPAGQ
jgi:AraC-like DNA-binding protein